MRCHYLKMSDEAALALLFDYESRTWILAGAPGIAKQGYIFYLGAFGLRKEIDESYSIFQKGFSVETWN